MSNYPHPYLHCSKLGLPLCNFMSDAALIEAKGMIDKEGGWIEDRAGSVIYGSRNPFDDLPKRTDPKPLIDFFHEPLNKVRLWTCRIILPNGEYHAGEGTTQCEALMLASIHWAMHGNKQ